MGEGALVERGLAMGQLLSRLAGSSDGTTTSLSINFDGAEPNDRCRDVYNECEETLSRAEEILDGIRGYGDGCAAVIRTALSSPSAEADDAVWEALCPRVAV